MSINGFPDIMGFFDMLYGAEGVDLGGLTCLYFGNATGRVWSGNPPFYLTDFLQIYPKFFGPPTKVSEIVITAADPIISGFTDVNALGLAVGQLVVNVNSILPDAIIQEVDTGAQDITISTIPIQDDTTFTVYKAPLIPFVAMLAYLNLAQASVMQSRYHESWPLMMSLFIAHYSTLYLRSDSGVPSYTARSAAASGLTTGIVVSQAAGDVSMSSKLLEGLDEFGFWRETSYGEQFATLARAAGAGAIWVK